LSSSFVDQQIFIPDKPLQDAGVFTYTVVMGLYNAEPFLPTILENLLRQSGGFPILLIDNYSADRTWELIQEWSTIFAGRLQLVRNPVNVGGWGSLLLNIPHITTSWFISMHQDDVYRSNHVTVLADAIHRAPETVVCIASDMGSLNNNGKPNRSAPPRAAWGLPDHSRQTLFITNLRLHNVPNPSSAFRTDTFAKFSGPWHSTAFPDTEWLLSALMENEVVLLPQVTMDYRENPMSESHIVQSRQKDLGAYLSLNRVFSSPNFVIFCKSVAEKDRIKFAEAIFDGVRIRVKDDRYLQLLELGIGEQLGLAWNYTNQVGNTVIQDAYLPLGATRVLELIADLNSFWNIPADGRPRENPSSQKSFPTEPQSLDKVITRRFVLAAFNLLPFRMRRIIFTALRLSGVVKPTSPWFSNWWK
jgi:Glycosyl transferase family 2